jgi:transketolase
MPVEAADLQAAAAAIRRELRVINTIRTLSIDAVQQAKSGHPGTPMALAPLVYTIWNRVMRFDPRIPIWPDRDRFVLSNGHASMLLWSVLHLTGTKAVNAEYERLGQPRSPSTTSAASASSTARRRATPSTTGCRASRPPPARSARALPPAWAWPSRRNGSPRYNNARIRHLRLQHLCRLRRRLHDGGHRVGGGLAGRPSGPRQPLLDLRQQSHHHRRQYAHRLHGRRRGPVSWVTDGTSAGGRRQRHRPHRARPQGLPETKGRPTFIILDSHIGYGSPHKQDTAEAHGEPLGEEEIRLTKRAYGWPEDAKFLVPDGVYEHFARASARAARRPAPVDGTASIPIGQSTPNWRPRSSRCSGASCQAGWDRNLPVFPPMRRESRDETPRAKC